MQASDKAKVLDSIKEGDFYDETSLGDLSEELRADKEIIMAWVEHMRNDDDFSYRQFEYVDSDLTADKEVVLPLLSKQGRALEWASESLKQSKDVAMAAVSSNGDALEDVYWEIRGDREIVLAACRSERGNYTLSFVSDSAELMGDREIVLAAILQGGAALQYASEDLRGDRELILAAVDANGHALNYASENLKFDIEIVLRALNTTKSQGHEPREILEYVSEEVEADSKIQAFLEACDPQEEGFSSLF